MTDSADLEALARRYLDLWQDQMTALAGDSEFIEAIDKLTAASGMAMPAGATAWPGVVGMMMAATGQPAGREREASDRQDSPQADSPGAAASGAASAAPSSGQRQSDLAELLGRLAALEERVAALESGPGRSRKSAQPKPRRSRS